MSIKFESPPAVSQRDLDKAAAKLSVVFPSEYAAFLLEHNGGIPQPNVLPGRGDDLVLERFYSLHRRITAKSATADLVTMTQHFRRELMFPESLLPIALVNGEDILVLTVAGRAKGRISLWSMIESGYDEKRVHKVADSFDKLIAKLDRPAARKQAGRRQLLEDLENAIMDGDAAAVRELAPAVNFAAPVPSDWVHPMHRAVLGGDRRVLKALHESGVDFRAKYDGVTPAQLARKSLREEKDAAATCRELGLIHDAKRAEGNVQRLERTVKFLKELKITR
jgi:hypothetical protein